MEIKNKCFLSHIGYLGVVYACLVFSVQYGEWKWGSILFNMSISYLNIWPM